MVPMNRLSWLLIIPILGGCADERISDATAKSKAVQIAKKLGLPSANPVIQMKGKRLTFVKIGHAQFGLDPKTGQFQVMSNTPIEAASLPSVAKPIRSEEDAWKRSDAVIKALGIAVYPRRQYSERQAGFSGVGMMVNCLYADRPYGYPADQTANYTLITHHKATGMLTEIMSKAGTTFEKPNIKLTKGQAQEAARQVMRRNMDRVPKIVACNLIFSEGNQFFGGVGDRLRNAKRMRLCYRIGFEGGAVDIDAETGDCLGGVILK